MNYPKALDGLIEHFRKYPGVGQKTAERYALFTFTHLSETDVLHFSEALAKLHASLKSCSVCGYFTEKEICEICTDGTRNRSQIMVVEEAKDVLTFERAHSYHGLYHVLGGTLAPSEGIGPEELNFKHLIERLKDKTHQELIIATNLNEAGETTALYLNHILKNTGISLTRIGYGLPAGGNIAYADTMTLTKALEGRKKM
jgi:recombination protein RecR